MNNAANAPVTTGLRPIPDFDPSVKIPPGVKAAADRADQLFRTSMGIAEPGAEEQTEDKSQEQQPEPQAQEQQPEAKPPVTATVKAPDEQSWEHRYNSMKGRFDRSQDQIRQMSEQITSLQNILATMQQAPAPAELRAERLITPEEESDYGSEFLKVVGKKAKEELTPEVAELRAELAQVRAKLDGVGSNLQQDARQRMLGIMDERIPNWREVNLNDDFKSWLALPDTYSGAIRHELLKAAFERNDTPRVMAFFNGFLAEEAAMDPAGNEPEQRTAQIPLETLAAPGRAKTTAATTAPAEKPSFTRAQIAKFYADVGAGKYRGRDAEKDKVERQIFDAQREGRIR